MNYSFKFAVFAYDFPHWKTQTGLQNLFVHGFVPNMVFAAPWKKLSISKPLVRVTPKDLYLTNPETVCQSLCFPYKKIEHESKEIVDYVSENNIDFGIILGARIIKPEVIKAFKYGIINFHPGILPGNRGLDNLKWAIVLGLENGVTAHWIDSSIDLGNFIQYKPVKIYKDDEIIEVQNRLSNLEQKMMIDLMISFCNRGIGAKGEEIKDKIYRGVMPEYLEKKLPILFDEYKQAMHDE